MKGREGEEARWRVEVTSCGEASREGQASLRGELEAGEQGGLRRPSKASECSTDRVSNSKSALLTSLV